MSAAMTGHAPGDGANSAPELLINDPFYAVFAAHPRCCVDYCLVRLHAPYRGAPSHRAALAFAMAHCAAADDGEGPLWTFDIAKAVPREIAPAALLAKPDRPWKRTEKWKDGGNVTVFLDYKADGGSVPYWFAFLEPPHGSNDTPEDFDAVNAVLFPAGTAALEAYEWSTDWSDYFDDGHEWWGVGCWSVYDPALDRFAVILASNTD